MKRIKFLAMLVLLTFVGRAFADNLKVNDITLNAGATQEIAIEMVNPDKTYTAFQFDLVLPEGITIAKNARNKLIASLNADRIDDQTLNVSEVGNNTYRFISFSMSNAEFYDAEGALVYVTLAAAEDITGGTKVATIASQVITEVSGDQYKWDDLSFNIAVPSAGIAIDATNFPDENFRAWLLEQDYGQDALLTEEEIEGITAMDFSGNYIVYPIGIYYFRALTDVLCSKAYLRSLDISKNSQLHSLDCSHNYLDSLDVSLNSLLHYLDCSHNYLDSLDVSLNSLLHYLDCSHNYLDSLDVSLNSQLHYLVCDTNYLESLDVSKNNLLHYLDCSHNYLKSLDVSKNSLLEKLVCSQNGQLTSLKISSNSLLSYLRCDGTQLQGVAMDEIIDNLPYNESGSLIVDVDKITSEQIQAARLKGWTVYRINSVGIEVLIDRNDFIYAVGEESNGSTIQTLYSPNGIIYQGFCYIDGKFKFCSDGTGNWEGEQWAAADEEGNLTAEDAANKYCPDPGTGFYHVSVDLNAMSYQLEPINSISIVVSQSTEMDEVYMSYNKDLGCWEAVLTVPSRERIKFRGNQNMEWGGSLDNLMLDGRFIPLMQVGSYLIRLYLSYDGNHKATVTPVVSGIAIDATNFPDENFRAWLLSQNYGQDALLTEEEIAGITIINVPSKGIADLTGIELFTNLKYLSCGGNQLTSLDLSKNVALTGLGCYENQIKDIRMDELISSLPTVASGNLYAMYPPESGEGNVITPAQVAAANAKGWKVFQYDAEAGDWVEMSGEVAPTGVAIDATNFPDENFRAWLLEQDYGLDGMLTEEEIAGITEIVVNEKGIADLTGLELFTNLTYLNCSSNQLTSLDVTKNVKLEFLNCEANKLTSLDVSYNTALVRLLCGHNQLTSLDVTKNVALTLLFCYNNQLKSLDVTNNVALTVLSIICNQISGTEMDKLVSSLPSIDYGTLFAIDYTQEEGNVVTPKQVSAANAKGWKVTRWDAETERYVEMSGEDPDGIQSTDKGQLTVDDAVIYNLSGQRLSKPQRGVNIINGKKMVVK